MIKNCKSGRWFIGASDIVFREIGVSIIPGRNLNIAISLYFIFIRIQLPIVPDFIERLIYAIISELSRIIARLRAGLF